MAKPQTKPQTTPQAPAAAAQPAVNPQVQVLAVANQPKSLEEAMKLEAVQLIAIFGNKSNAIRGLSAMGAKTGEISKKLGIIYQHARNVLKRPLKREIKEARDNAKAQTGDATTAKK